MEYIHRTMEKTILNYVGKYPVIMVTGPRQVGKTTLLNYISTISKEEINFVTLDDRKIRLQANEDPELFLREHELPLIIDEFQYAPNLLSYIKIKVDEARREAMFGNKKEVGTLYYLTGSQVFQTMEDVSESLAGRIGIFDLYPLTCRELQNLEEKKFNPQIDILKKKTPTERVSIPKLFERILRGSYPELNFGNEIDIENYYRNYINTYIERDIRKIINIKDENKFMKFISSIAARTGQEFIASSVGAEIGIDSKTAEKWISVLANTGIIYLLQPYSNNALKRAVKHQKIYFMDTGLACYLAGYTNATTLSNSAYSGAIFETYIISEIIKTYTNCSIDPRKHLYFYRDNNQKEIDLIIIDNNVAYPIEIKKSSNPGSNAIKNFDIVNKFETEVGNGIVLCLCKDIMAIDNNNYYVPIEYI